MDLVFSHLRVEMLLSLLVAAFIARLAVPSIVRIAIAKQLVATPNGRTSHEGAVPYLGGISIFASLVISASLFVVDGFNREFQFILPGLLIIFFFGIKDDIANLSAKKKLFGQVLASLIVIVLADVRIFTFHGLFGIYDLPLYTSYAFSLVVFLGVINAFNLIDGIDGLASGLGIQISVLLGLWLAFLQKYDYAVFAFALTGGLIPFYFYNVFGKKYKLFMGDTGSLLIGFVFAVLAVKVLCCELPPMSKLYAEGLPVLVASTMVMPLTDTIRVFLIRIARGRSPFSADKNHFHHYLLQLGLNHRQASFIIVLLNTGLFLLAFTFRHWNDLRLGTMVFGTAFIITMLPGLILSVIKKRSAGRSLVEQ